jgi:hypothetical protein
MFSKFGQTLTKEGKDASREVTSSMLMGMSIVKVDCHVKRDIVRGVHRSFVECTQMGANRW